MLREQIKKIIQEFITDFQVKHNVRSHWREPIVKFANADNPTFLQLKQLIDKDHKLPNELLKNAETVISFFIPFKEEIVSSNSNGLIASRKWAEAYIITNKLIIGLTKHLTEMLGDYDCFEIPPTHNFDKIKLKSYWSHKHAAYIAGLGKFGVHKMLITEKGCCGRLGSLITSAKIQPSERILDEYCLYFLNESCSMCIDHCVFNALSGESFDRHKCYQICLGNGKLYSKLGLSDICGKCACGVPCSIKNPCI
ncbi:hypothetical protein LCGC14_1052550 [marine sediment metagenome]|uniref:4Fe-4S ferredoxin-type domain-containing protein n=1 Tax=marine sediment metagenome TaxID=412755 RepID=A0A0F9NAA4_9ZZZZ|nr:MAG: Epoxyqueuosine reductase [Candidatus Lokiarchaeum sp. GC14_75]